MMKKTIAVLLSFALLLCAGCSAALKADDPGNLPGDADALVLLDAKAAGEAVLVTVSAATFSEDGTSYTYSEEITYSFEAAREAFQANLYDGEGAMRQYAADSSFCDAVAAANAEGDRPVCDYAFDQEGRLTALDARARG
jgi:ABC-type amino acid transport substrate-binding protein